MAGKVYLVGIGPGDVDFMTLRAARILAEADAVYYGPGVASEVIDLISPTADRCPVGAAEGRPERTPRAVRHEMAERAGLGQQVVSLIPGDPMLFHRGSEEAIALAAAGVDFEIVPGIAPSLAGPVFAGVPVTHGGISGLVTLVYVGGRVPSPPAIDDEVTRKVPPEPEAPPSPPEGSESAASDAPPDPEAAGENEDADKSERAGVDAAPNPDDPLGRVVHEGRVGRGVVVRRRNRPTDAETPARPGTPVPGISLRRTNLVEIVEDSPAEAARGLSIEKPLVRDRQQAPGQQDEEAAGGSPYPAPDWEALSRVGGTVVLVLGRKALAFAVERLLAAGRPTDDPAAVIRDAGSNRQHTLTGPLSTLVRVANITGIQGDCLLVLGDVVLLREELDWFESRPLFGYRVAMTDFEHQTEEDARLLEENGAVVYQTPLLRVAPLPDAMDFLPVPRDQVSQYDMIVFSSPAVVRIFLDSFLEDGKDPRRLTGPRIVALHPATAVELKRYGIQPDLVIEEIPKRGLADRLEVGQGKKVLMPRAARARDLIPVQIRERGAEVDILPVYDTLPDEEETNRLRSLLDDNQVDLIVHGTSTGFDFLWESMDQEERGWLLTRVDHGATGGGVAADLQSKGIPLSFQVQDHTPNDLVRAILEHRTETRHKAKELP